MWLVRAFVPRLVLIKMAQSTKAHIFTKIRIKFAFLTFVTLFFGSSLAPCSLYSLSLSLPLAFTVASAHLPLHAPKRVYMCVYIYVLFRVPFIVCANSLENPIWQMLR